MCIRDRKKAIVQRDTDNAEAHNLYLMARQTYIIKHEGDARSAEVIIRLCTRATEIDPDYAQAWTLMGIGYKNLRYLQTVQSDAGMQAVEHALALNPNPVSYTH